MTADNQEQPPYPSKTTDWRSKSHSTLVRHGPYPELTWESVVVGWFLGALIAVSIGYASLILGFSIEGSELAAILGWGILRGLMRRTSIVENNINQTIASAVNGASAGMMFSIPALFILEQQYGGWHLQQPDRIQQAFDGPFLHHRRHSGAGFHHPAAQADDRL